jgi:peptidoglycan/LPS O-acetylase OafA/YrhL
LEKVTLLPPTPALDQSASEGRERSGDIRYGADIDGLRAVAVLLVIVFHMGLQPSVATVAWISQHISPAVAARLALGIPGGFIGVDIFFVISGFLIGGILLREQSAGTFSIVRFYERRVRRILPALMAVLVFVLVAGYAALLPYEYREVGVSVLASIFSASNFFFLRHSGYFEPGALAKPLLHTWSLAVEEQFYVVCPLVLLLLRRVSKAVLQVTLGALALTSFAFSVYEVHARPDAAFYLPFPRGWELLVGVLLAAGVLPPLRAKTARNAASLSGLGLIAAAALALTATTPFPGAAALLPCFGAALIIYAGETGPSFVGRALSWRPVVFVGLISYSLYLWHWPLLLVNKYEYFSFVRLNSLGLFVLMLLVASLSWLLVEQPFRAGRFRPGRKALFASSAVAVTLVSVVGIWAYRSNGAPGRFREPLLSLAGYPERGSNDLQWTNGCFVHAGHSAFEAHCLQSSPDRLNLLLLGDSHAAHLRDGLTNALPEVNILQATASNCKPLLTSKHSSDDLCRELTDQVFDHYLREHRPDAVLLSALWQATDLKALAETVRQIHAEHQRVYVFGPSPAYDQPLPILLIKASFRKDQSMPIRHLDPTASEFAALDDKMRQTAMAAGADRFISLRKLMCNDSSCMEYVTAGVPIEFDASHLTAAGSRWVGEQLRDTHQLP